MGFYQLGRKEEGNVGSTFFMIALIILTFIISQFAVQLIALKVFGFSLIDANTSINKNVVFALLLAPFAVVFGVIRMAYPRIHKRPFKSVLTSRERLDWKRMMFSFSIWMALLGALLLLDVFLGSQLLFNLDISNFIILLLFSFTLLVLQTSVEEVLFRGYLFQQLGKVFPASWMGILITGVVFGLMHGSNPEIMELGSFFIMFYVVTGIFLGIITQMDGGLELSLGYHAANNIFAAIIVTNDWQAFQTDAIFISVSEPPQIIEVLITLLIIQPLLIVLFAKKYNWKNWKEKLISSKNDEELG
jgi:membrane protease YdiL (CAAX protease family)